MYGIVRIGSLGGFVREVQIGRRYRKVGAASMVWRVIAVVPDQIGIPHCRIVDESDPTNIKLISEKTLANPKFYQLVGEAC